MKRNTPARAGLILCGLFIISVYGCSKCNPSSTSLVGDWSRSSDFDGFARSDAAIFTIGDSAYVATGTTDRQKFQDVWQFDIAQGYWRQLADMPGAGRGSAVAFSINNLGYIASGIDANGSPLNDVWQFDPKENSWKAMRNFPNQMQPRYEAVGFSIGNYGYIGTGFNGNYLKDFWQYDPIKDSFVQKASISGSKRMSASTFVVNDKGYVLSGLNNGSTLNDLWMYDPTTGNWTEKNKISNVNNTFDASYTSIQRDNAVTFIMNGLVYLAVGENGSPQADTWEYNPGSDLWTKKTPWESPALRVGSCAFTLKERGFVLTGRSGTQSFDDVWEWHPNEPVNTQDN